MDRAWGIDVSHHRPVVDWAALARSGLNIFGAKATNGLSVDRKFQEHRDGARDRLPVDLALYYHFPTPRSSALAQADKFVAEVGELRPHERLVLDVELAGEDGGAQWCPDLRFVDEFFAELSRLVGDRRHLIYTSARIWRDQMDGADWERSSEVDLWVPRYGVAEPELPRAANAVPLWLDWTIWQNSESFPCAGVAGVVDHDLFNGSVDDLRAYAGGTA